MQIRNDYDKEVFNGDIGIIVNVNTEDGELAVDFDGREVTYDVTELDELVLAYATTIHKSQGSEYPIVVMPLTMSHYVMLQRNLLYTGVTRAKKILVIVGERRAIAYAVHNETTTARNTKLAERLRELVPSEAQDSQDARSLETGSKIQNIYQHDQDFLKVAEPRAFYGGADIFERLAKSEFRSSFKLNDRYKAYVREKGMNVIRSHAVDFVAKRLAPAEPVNDGRQTPMQGHPVFIAQHATATCCRGCLEKWHRIPKGRELTIEQQEYIVNIIMEWIERQMLS